jgi:hypothetical protein
VQGYPDTDIKKSISTFQTPAPGIRSGGLFFAVILFVIACIHFKEANFKKDVASS